MPFCFHKCHYCDFYSLASPADHSPDRQAAFTRRLIAELRFRADQTPLRPTTVFIGGGTPTFLAAQHWHDLLTALHQMGTLNRCHEFTVEANPETVTGELMHALAAGGVNRVSIGAQSFDPRLLKTLERWHEPQNVRRAVDLCRAAGIDNINLDLIFAIPGQDLPLLEADLQQALALTPDHLSCYGLTYEPNTAMTTRLRLGQVTAAEEDLERLMFEHVIARLAEAGFEHYEVSNWARCIASDREVAGPSSSAAHPADARLANTAPPPSRRCLHNMIYWTNGNYLGLGPGAASHIDGRRWKNEPHLGRYLASLAEGRACPPVVDDELLAPPRRVGEALMLGLRLRQGVPETWLEEHLPGNDPRRATIADLEALGLLRRADAHLQLTHAGLMVADAVIARLL